MTVDLKGMSRKDLEKYLVRIEKALVATRARDLREARKAAQKAVAGFGLTLGDISEDTAPKAKAKKVKSPSKPKIR